VAASTTAPLVEPVTAGREASLLARLAGALVSPAGSRARLLIVTYHRVLPSPDPLLPYEVDRATFERHVALFAGAFSVLSLREAAQRLARGSLPARALVITFDDGYANNVGEALPVLSRHGIGATFFIATGFLDGGLMFNDAVIEGLRACPAGRLDLTDRSAGEFEITDAASRRAAIEAILRAIKHREPGRRAEDVACLLERCGTRPPGVMMSSRQVVELQQAGMEIGGHTVNHPILKSVAADEAEAEIREGKERLEALLREPVHVFAYPNGRPGLDYDPSHVALVRGAGFEAAVSTAQGSASRRADLLQLPRVGTPAGAPLRIAASLTRAWLAAS
jgi:peptidoglycan/xylan/chitin deacetylase (PgdA/CDA1 family)